MHANASPSSGHRCHFCSFPPNTTRAVFLLSASFWNFGRFALFPSLITNFRFPTLSWRRCGEMRRKKGNADTLFELSLHLGLPVLSVCLFLSLSSPLFFRGNILLLLPITFYHQQIIFSHFLFVYNCSLSLPLFLFPTHSFSRTNFNCITPNKLPH